MNDPNQQDSSRAEPPNGDPLADRLIGRACDDILGDDDAAQLQELLRNDERARTSYLEAMGIEALLAADHESDPMQELLALASPDFRPSDDRDATPVTRSGLFLFENTRALPWLMALAASLLLCVGGLRLWEQSHDLMSARVIRPPDAMLGKRVGELGEMVAAKWETPVTAAQTLVGGQRLRLLEGTARLALDRGVELTLTGPAEVEIVSGMQVRATQGSLTAVASSQAAGFVLETPSAQLVQVGPDLGRPAAKAGIGVEIDESGATDVAVLDGCVDLQYLLPPAVRVADSSPPPISFRSQRAVRELTAGQVFHVALAKTPRNKLTPGAEGDRQASPSLVREVKDLITSGRTTRRYSVIPGGLKDDARAFMDRLHQWNSLGEHGFPAALQGADLIPTYNADRLSVDRSILLDIDGPSDVFVLLDERVPPPRWLQQRFQLTEWKLGLDEGWNDAQGNRYALSAEGLPVPTDGELIPTTPRDSVASGPGNSIDAVAAVWRLELSEPTRLILGPIAGGNEHTHMYGIAVKAR